ncbi:MAG: hypothetical protein AAGA58_14230 [Verrucomicrobiota bacterium]
MSAIPGGHSWFRGEINPKPTGDLRYKISAFRTTAGGNVLNNLFPFAASAVDEKIDMMSVFEVTDFDATTVSFRPHNDHGDVETGLEEGFHILRTRAFLDRFNRAALYNTFAQTFYYDTKRPEGEILFPGNDGDTLGSQNFGVVVRTDPSVDEVWYQIVDSDSTNDDTNTGVLNGNGPGFEPFVDTNQNGQWDSGEQFEDLDENGVFTSNFSASWVRATDVTFRPNIGGDLSFAKEWRFTYNNIPSTGTGQIYVRLREISSAERVDFTESPTGADDVAKHYTTLSRSVNTAGPDIRRFVAFPQMDGDVVDYTYVMKANFSKALGDGVSDAQLIDEFLIRIGSTISGSIDFAVTQDPANYSIVRNETADFHALAFTFPNLFNGDPNFLHHVEVTHTRDGNPTLMATRLVKAAEVSEPFVNIIEPAEFDEDGQRLVIELLDVASPTPAQRSSSVVVETDVDAVQVDIAFELGSGTITLDTGQPVDLGSRLQWNFTWSSMTEGNFRLRADMREVLAGPVVASATRNTEVAFLESVLAVNEDPDDDDDGLLDVDELTPVNLPNTNSETWTNGEVHIATIYGRTDPGTPDADGDLLPDELESGWRVPVVEGEEFQDTGWGAGNFGVGNGIFDWDDANGNFQHDVGEASEPFTDANSDSVFDFGTIVTTDTNGDGFPNFIADLDPPFYNTVPDNNGLPNFDFNRGRTDLIHGTLTDPNNPDTDGDGIQDGIEDADRDGHVDGDGSSLGPTQDPSTRVSWPNGMMDTGETWTETDPNNPDTDDDDLSDGFGEDKDGNGMINGDTNNNRIHEAGEAWSETDPLSNDTDGDGLLDGWEVQNDLDPLDNGTDNLATAAADDGDLEQGASGDPDMDNFDNATEQSSGTKPLIADNQGPPPAASIAIGPGVDGKDFTDWTCEDLVALDEYEGDGTNSDSGDTYLAFDGFDTSRDITAFYFRDAGADGNLYFRLDFYDLRPFAEEGNLDIYVVIDTGNTAVGEFALPDEVDIGTEMRWEAVVACYQSNNGIVYVDENPAMNSTNINEDLFAANGVNARNQNVPDGFGDAYYNSDLDAAEFSVSRQALLDAGWNGSSALRFQVFTTRDGTQNDGMGLGDIGGRNDLRDTIFDDYLSENSFFAQANIAANGVFESAISAEHDNCKRTKLVLLTHVNRPLLPASELQESINTGFGMGYHPTLDAHELFDEPMTLHITPTAASGIEWAAVDLAETQLQYLDGPAFNDRISALITAGNLDLLGSTFADHIPAYFDASFNNDNVNLSNSFLTEIYGSAPSSTILYPPERVMDADILGKVSGAGFSFTFVDQMRHLFKWFGRSSALSNDGYRINDIHGVKCLAINDQANAFRFQTFDNGLPLPLRNLFNRKARSSAQDQVITLFFQWDDMSDPGNADAYDTNLRWITNTPWVEVVTPTQIASGEVDIDGDNVGDVWGMISRGAPSIVQTSQDFIDHATQESYDNWYLGQVGREEGLSGKVFEIRPSSPVPQAYGRQSANDGLVADAAWDAVTSMNDLTSPLGQTARATAHASMFLTAFHEQQNNDLSKFSNGTYISPDTDFNNLSGLSLFAQSQTRFAAMFKRVETWALAPPVSTTTVASQEDIDLDGEAEYLLFNHQVFAVFEAIGGRLVAAWARNPNSGRIYQVVGNQISYANSATEEEGAANNDGGAPAAHRTSGFKDWSLNGSGAFVNDLYTISTTVNGWKFASSGGEIMKSIHLPPGGATLMASYSLANSSDSLDVRFGLSPNLYNLLLSGQENLGDLETSTPGAVRLVTTTVEDAISARVSFDGANFVAGAIDDAPAAFVSNAIPMRNQAQTHQVEFANTAQNFTLGLNLATNGTDDDFDLLPTNWEEENGLDPNDDGSGNVDNGPNGNPDGDRLSNAMEFLYNLDPQVADDHLVPRIEIFDNGDGTYDLEFPTYPDRAYFWSYSDNLTNWLPMGNEVRVFEDTPDFRKTDDGSETSPHPQIEDGRFYRVEITFPSNP